MDKVKKAFENRDISGIRFNKRILEEAMCADNPLYERLHFLSIFCKNLDEFYMTRMGILKDECALNKEKGSKEDKKEAKERYNFITETIKELLGQKDCVYADLMRQFRGFSVKQITAENMTPQEHEYLRGIFENQLSHALSPVVFGENQEFPFVNNKQLLVAVSLKSKNEPQMGIVEIPATLPRVFTVPNSEPVAFILAEDLIFSFVDTLFKKHTAMDKAIVRITRNADIDEKNVLSDDAVDLKESILELIKKRAKMAPVRMECVGDGENTACRSIRKALDLDKKQVVHQSAPLDMTFIEELKTKIPQQKQPALYYEPLKPRITPEIITSELMLDQIKKKDILMSYPFEDFEQFIRLLNEAGADQRVNSIKITLYRVADNSKIIEALIQAAKNGKDVLCVVELRAKFDESENIEWTRKLEIGGCKVVYGPKEFKVHSKMLLITLKSENGQEYITQIGTGNYNEKTAKEYCDFSLLSANQDIGSECAAVFDKLQHGKLSENTSHLLVAPLSFKNKILEQIDQEIAKAKQGKKASIIFKINGLTDKGIMKKLIEASQCGVHIQLIVRDICCLKASVEGLTDCVTVRSIVGRFLEHSRIFKFGEDSGCSVYISSADLMTRNTAHRVETAVPVYDPGCKAKVCLLLQRMLEDNVKARIQKPDGTYEIPPLQTADKKMNYQLAMTKRD